MTNNNDLELFLEKLRADYLNYNGIHTKEYMYDFLVTEKILKYISQNFIPLSSLEKFIEENEEEWVNDNTGGGIGFKLALKLLDKFIHE